MKRGPDQPAGAPPLPITDFTGDLDDFADTAAFIAALDLIVSVDTSVPHLAGAMGKEVWLMFSLLRDWRWPLAGEGTPWYPSMRLFRQKRFRDWNDVIQDVVAALRLKLEQSKTG